MPHIRYSPDHVPKGITHRSMLCAESEDENVLLELKIRGDLTFVGNG